MKVRIAEKRRPKSVDKPFADVMRPEVCGKTSHRAAPQKAGTMTTLFKGVEINSLRNTLIGAEFSGYTEDDTLLTCDSTFYLLRVIRLWV